MRAYVKHSSAERARLRDPLFAQPANRQLAFEVLQKQPGIAGISQGPESFLLFLEPEASIEQICDALETRLPELAHNQGVPQRSDVPAKRGNPYRKLILRTYLATGITTVTLAALGFYHWHKAFGWIFSAFAVEHVWKRRRAL